LGGRERDPLLGAPPQVRLTVSVPGPGRRLMGGALQVDVQRQEAEALLPDGFLPYVKRDARPRRHQSGFQEFGLPYAPDPAITAYLAAFLTDNEQLMAVGGDGGSARAEGIFFYRGEFYLQRLQPMAWDVVC